MTADETTMADSSSTPPPSANDDGWSDEEIETMLGTAILLGVATLVIYYAILRPIFNPKPNEGATAGAGGGRQQQALQARNNNNNNNNMANDVARRQRQPPHGAFAAGSPARAAVGGGLDATASLPASVASGKRRPPHLVDSCSGGPSGSRYLVEGLVPFKRSLAGAYESSKSASGASQSDEDMVTANRKLRARLLARLLNPTLTGAQTKTPPARGSNIIVCVPSSDAGCAKLHQALYLLGTYFNLFLVLTISSKDDAGGAGSMDESDKEKELLEHFRAQLRGSDNDGVPIEVLPDHRIVAARTVEGKVAFVRQMHRTVFVLDCDVEMKTHLERFGFMVLLYGQGDEKRSGDGVSLLGKTLMP